MTSGLFFMDILPNNKPLEQTQIKQAICRWVMNDYSLDELCVLSNKLNIKGIDLVGPKEWHILKKHNIDCSMCNGAEIGLTKGWNNPQFHSTLINNYLNHINLVAEAGYKNLICFSGNRDGMTDDVGLVNSVLGLKQIMSLAEKKGVIIQLELFNSLVNHPDYMADSTAWGVELCKRVGSPNLKLLYDIYHMQVQEGNIIDTIDKYHPYFGHYHTAGVPGRQDIDSTQELNYSAIMRKIKSLGYTGYVAHEFITKSTDKKGKIKAIKQAIKTCTV